MDLSYAEALKKMPDAAVFTLPMQRDAQGSIVALIAQRGRRGYMLTDWALGQTWDEAEAAAAVLNTQAGISADEANKIVYSTMKNPSSGRTEPLRVDSGGKRYDFVMTPITRQTADALKRYREDLAAGHTEGAEYWRGMAAGGLTANPYIEFTYPELMKEIEREVEGKVEALAESRGLKGARKDRWVSDVLKKTLVRVNYECPPAYQYEGPDGVSGSGSLIRKPLSRSSEIVRRPYSSPPKRRRPEVSIPDSRVITRSEPATSSVSMPAMAPTNGHRSVADVIATVPYMTPATFSVNNPKQRRKIEALMNRNNPKSNPGPRWEKVRAHGGGYLYIIRGLALDSRIWSNRAGVWSLDVEGSRLGPYRTLAGAKAAYLEFMEGESVIRSGNPTYTQEMQAKHGVPFDPTRLKRVKGFRFGDRVRQSSTGEAVMWSHVPVGAEGTVWAVAGFRGHSISPDPAHSMIMVKWDEHGDQSVWAKALTKIKGKRVKQRGGTIPQKTKNPFVAPMIYGAGLGIGLVAGQGAFKKVLGQS